MYASARIEFWTAENVTATTVDITSLVAALLAFDELGLHTVIGLFW
jgi:hypothetical protein